MHEGIPHNLTWEESIRHGWHNPIISAIQPRGFPDRSHYPWRGNSRQSPRNAGIPIQDPTTMFPVNQLPNVNTSGFPVRYNMPIPGNVPFWNPNNPEGSMFPVNQLPNRSHFNRVMPGPTGPMMEGNNPPINMPQPSLPSIGPFAQYMRRIGMPLPNDPVANAPRGLGLGFR